MIRDALELGIARAYVRGELEINTAAGVRGLRVRSLAAAVRAALTPTSVEYRPTGMKRAARRDKASVQFHYDVSQQFYQIMLGPSMVYSCAEWDIVNDLETAQKVKIDRILDQLRVGRGDHLLDIGAGWGTLLNHAAARGARATGVTLSENQAAFHNSVSLCDYRALDGVWNKIVSVGMIEHVGREQVVRYFNKIADLLTPRGLALVHGITKEKWTRQSKFIQRYVFPDGDILPYDVINEARDAAGLELVKVRALPQDSYPKTLRAWLGNIEANRIACVRLIGPERLRVWRLYLAASAQQFEAGNLTVHQFLLRKP